jgi:hypothetical protein
MTMTRPNPWTIALFLLPLLACKAEDPSETDANADTGSSGTSGGTTADTPTTGEPMDCSQIEIPAIDESSCVPLATDFQPRTNAGGDMWPTCLGDGSAARVDAYEAMATLLWDNAAEPTAADFTAARDQYVIAEGLESRLNRREDLHYDPIPMDEWDPMVDGDKQCTVPDARRQVPRPLRRPQANEADPRRGVRRRPDRRGRRPRPRREDPRHPRLVPLLSVYKEAETCGSVKAADCDSAWAYYTGVEPIARRQGHLRRGSSPPARTPTSASTTASSPSAAGVTSTRTPTTRCSPTSTPTPSDQFELGWEQLDQSLHRGFALLVRPRRGLLRGRCAAPATPTRRPSGPTCRSLGPSLQREADERDAAQAATLAALWANAEPTAQEVADGIAALDCDLRLPVTPRSRRTRGRALRPASRLVGGTGFEPATRAL